MSANNQEYSSALAFAQVRAYHEDKLNNLRRRIQFNVGRLNNIQRELATLEETPLPRPKVIPPSIRNPFEVVDVSDQMANIAERAERIRQLKATITEVKETIRKLEEEEQTSQSWVDQSYL